MKECLKECLALVPGILLIALLCFTGMRLLSGLNFGPCIDTQQFVMGDSTLGVSGSYCASRAPLFSSR